MHKRLKAAATVGALFTTALAGPASAATITLACGTLGIGGELCRSGANAWAEQSGHEVEFVSTPNSTTERLALYQQFLSAGSSDIDVLEIDVIWPGILGEHFIDLTEYADGAQDNHFEAIVRNNTYEGRLVAMPWFTDAGVLYYRKDLLEKYDAAVPRTWEAMAATAERIQKAEREAGNDRLWGFVFQGRAYEGLTCDALEWVNSYGGGTIVDRDGTITINNPRAAQALTEAASWIERISPNGVLNYAEEEARGVFQSGNAVFMRNWPYAWSLAQSPDSPVKGKVGVSALPAGDVDGGKPAGTLGGWQLSVSRYSENPAIAADLVMFLTSREEQKRRAIKGSLNPTIPALYKDEEVLAAVPFFESLYDVFINAVPRPSTVTGGDYNRVSSEFWNAVHDVISGRMEAEASLKQLEGSLKRIKRGGW